MALGAITVVEQVAAQGPIFWDRVTIVGDDSYPTGGSTGFEALLQAAVAGAGEANMSGRQVVGLWLEQGQGGVMQTEDLHYDHATDTLIASVLATGAEVANTTALNGNTYSVLVASK
jgi:hypothetical protein